MRLQIVHRPHPRSAARESRERPGASAPRRERRGHGPLQDNAFYSCHCGFQFNAPVSTSVCCPCCGGGQAW
jgi:hypothetical protein